MPPCYTHICTNCGKIVFLDEVFPQEIEVKGDLKIVKNGMNNKFKNGDVVKHKKGGVYRIIFEPDENSLLEYNREPYYMYIEEHGTGPFYLRCKSEMEDGRFWLTSQSEWFIYWIWVCVQTGKGSRLKICGSIGLVGSSPTMPTKF